MWLFLPCGFYSAVAAIDQKTQKINVDYVCVRTRFREHAVELVRAGLCAESDIIDTDNRDYAHRVILPRAGWVQFVATAADSIDYDNFKNACFRRAEKLPVKSEARRQAYAYEHTLHGAWGVMKRAQTDEQMRNRKSEPDDGDLFDGDGPGVTARNHPKSKR